MSSSKKAIGFVLLQIALGLFLIVSGLFTIQLDGGFLGNVQASFSGNEVANAVRSFLKGDVANIVIFILGICELLAGIFLLISFFVNVGKIEDTILLIIMIVWILVIVLVDIIGNGGLLNGALKSFSSILSFLKVLSNHLLVLASIIIVKRS